MRQSSSDYRLLFVTVENLVIRRSQRAAAPDHLQTASPASRVFVGTAGLAALVLALLLCTAIPIPPGANGLVRGWPLPARLPTTMTLTLACLVLLGLAGGACLTIAIMRARTASDRRAVALSWKRGTDRLTGLFNRNTMDELLELLQQRPERAAIIMIDLDRFRSANHTLGRADADSVLQEVARRLQAITSAQDLVRTGGDEFAIFCRDIGSVEATNLTEQILATIATPFPISEGRSFHVTASVGLAHGETEGLSDLRDAADEALYFAKRQGGNQAVLFAPPLHRVQIERAGLEQDLHRAFRNNSELFLVYQPIISLRDNSVIAIEALARWQHPQIGLVPPGRFVGIAEAAGMGLGLGAKIREIAVSQVAAWRDLGISPLPVVNLNVSPQELSRADVPADLGALIDRYGLHRSDFCIEVTEGIFTDTNALATLRAAREAGFKIAMDDFGTGYSSLAQLPRLPLTSLKLDRSFLGLAMASEEGISLFATIVQLAHVLKLPVVAEGVETADELAVVVDCGCDLVQGFLFARPLSAAQIETCLQVGPDPLGVRRFSWL
jgi:diguanylate cyclase (GGDEF)-like protein